MRSHKRVALVTGAGRRLGRHIALALAEDGFDIALHFHTSERGAMRALQDIQKMKGTAHCYKSDLTRIPQLTKLVRNVASDFGRIDVLVNSAAVFIEKDIQAVTPEVWDRVIDANLRSVFFLSQQVARVMQRTGRGRIINIASLGGIQAWARHIPYSVSKAGVIMLTRCLARALAPDILVNAIAPGTIDMGTEEYPGQQHISKHLIPLKKFGAPNDITSLVLYLASMAGYITGQTIIVDGGRAA